MKHAAHYTNIANGIKRIKQAGQIARLIHIGVMKAQETGTMFSKIGYVFNKVTIGGEFDLKKTQGLEKTIGCCEMNTQDRLFIKHYEMQTKIAEQFTKALRNGR